MKTRKILSLILSSVMTLSAMTVQNANSETAVNTPETDMPETVTTAEAPVTAVAGNDVEILSSGTFDDNLSWSVNSEGVLTISGTGALDYNALKKDDDFFKDPKDKIKEIVINNGITSIKDNAFFSCGYIESITLPDTVRYIGNSAFYSCSKLRSADIPDSVEYIGAKAFSNCSKLESMTLPDNIKNIQEQTFFECSSLESVTIPDSVEYIGTNAFMFCESLKNVTLSDSLVFIDDGAFEDCVMLEALNIPASVMYIGDRAFCNCEKLSSLTIDGTVEYIGNKAFGYCRVDSAVVDSATTAVVTTTATATTNISTAATTTGNYINRASISITPPTKRVYHIGEELDLTGGNAIASGGTYDNESNSYVVNWDQFNRIPLDDSRWKIDSSEFDNTKPGIYPIYVSCMANSVNDFYEVKGSFIVIVADETSTSEPVTTAPKTTAVTTTTATTETTDVMVSTFAPIYHNFAKVISYPTKTEYVKGEQLDFKGLECEFEGESDSSVRYKEARYCDVLDKDGKSVSGTAFSTLPAGEYTVKFYEDITYYGHPMQYFKGMDISYKVTIREASEEELKEREEDDDPDPSYGFVWGDANLDGYVDMADAVLIMQSLANPDKYGVSGTSKTHIKKNGLIRGDVDTSIVGLTSNDALFIQRYLLNKISTLDPNSEIKA